ncbi:MAG: amidohydrolase family protein [Fimbriimonadaceae bacterium]|nr:amidohydrolase family protein [Fimbriimonadaceae bacterium]
MSLRWDCHTHVGVEHLHWLTGAFPYAQQLVDLLRDLDAARIDRVVVFPMVSHYALDPAGLQVGRITPCAVPWSRYPYEFENHRLLAEVYDLFPDLAPRVRVLAMIDPARQAAEQIAGITALAARYPIAGLKMQGTIIQSPVTALPGSGFLELAADRDWPLLIHSSIHAADVWSQAADILEVAAQWPQLRFNVAHTLRLDAVLLDRLASLPNCWSDVSAFCIHCDLAAEDSPITAPPERRLPVDYHDCGAVLRAYAERYPAKLLWGSDAPYFSFVAQTAAGEGRVERYDLRSSMAREAAALAALPTDLQAALTVHNPLAWLGGSAA